MISANTLHTLHEHCMHKLLSHTKLVLGAVLTSAPLLSLAAIDLTCYVGAEKIETVQMQLLRTEGMIPVTSHFRNVGTDEKASWAMATLMMNPSTRRGYEWARMPQGHVCIAKSYEDIELMSNTSFRAAAFVSLKAYPSADDVGDGRDLSTSGINAILIGNKSTGKNPMYKATVSGVLDLTGAGEKSKAVIEVLVSNPTTKEGVLLSAGPSGRVLGTYTKVVGLPDRDGVKFGAIYSPAAEEMLGLKKR
jgi:hypothetical protein